MRLDRFLSKHGGYSNREVREQLANGEITIAGKIVENGATAVDAFSDIRTQGKSLQQRRPVYIALNKPKGYVSATKDYKHKTVLDLIDHPQKHELHLAGRLDFNTTGLVLLSNHGSWSNRVTMATAKLPKTYLVTTEQAIAEDTIERFRSGFYFATENITTLPAELSIIGGNKARLVLHEGRYHQVKRMFARTDNKVTALHRESVGKVSLGGLSQGKWRLLTPPEIASVFENTPL